MPLLGASQEVAKKDARTFPPGPPFPCRSAKRAGEKNIESFSASLDGMIPRAAGAERKRFCGFLKGIRPLSAFSSPILCGKAKNRHQPSQRGAQLYARQVAKTQKNWVFLSTCRFATTSGRRRKQTFVANLTRWRSWGRGPHFLRELFFGTAHVLSHTGIGVVVGASAPIPFLKVLEGVWGNFFQEVPLRVPLIPQTLPRNAHTLPRGQRRR